MRVAIFSTKSYDRRFLESANKGDAHDLVFFEACLTSETSGLAAGFPAVCAFVNDRLTAEVLENLAKSGMRLIAMRCAGFNNVDLSAARELALTVVRVPDYSPHAVAEHTVALILALNRRIHRAYNRVREGNFTLDGLAGFHLYGRTAGIIGTGKIGAAVARILKGFGCNLVAYDPVPNPDCVSLAVKYVPLEELFSQSDIISLHWPLTPQTQHLIDSRSLARMRPGVMLINTSRGGLIDTRAVIGALKSSKIAYLGLDVYEEEADLFFEDLSDRVIRDDVFSRLLTFPNVIITGHQGFFTQDALKNIAETTLSNITDFKQGRTCANEVTTDVLRR